MNRIERIFKKMGLIVLTSVYVVVCGCLFPFIFIGSSISNRFAEKSQSLWTFVILLFIKLFIVEKIRLHYNPKILSYKKSIFISNHVNNIDWFMIWISLLVMKKKKVIYSAKNSLFLFGTAVKRLLHTKSDFVFLKRQLNYDYITLVDACNKMKNMKEYTTVLFPEGTLLCHKKTPLVNIRRCSSRNVKTTQNVIFPKTKGFEILIECLKGELNGIMNCTLKYSNFISFVNFVKGKRITVDIFIDALEVPESNYDSWLVNKFLEKDNLIGSNSLHNKKYLTIDINLSRKYWYAITLATPWIVSKIKDYLKRKITGKMTDN